MRRPAPPLPLIVLATVLALATPSHAGDDAPDAIVEAVGEVLHGSDAATRERARETLRENPDAAVRVLLRALEELSAARRPPVATATPAPSDDGDRAAAPPTENEGQVVRVYDVRDLVGGTGTVDELSQRLRDAVGGQTTIEPHEGGMLVVRTSPLTHADIEDRLNALRQGMDEMVRIETRVIAAPLTAPLGTEVVAARAGDVVALDDPLAALDRWVTAGDAEIVTAPALSCFPGQRASVHAGREISFVADFDVEVAQSAFIADPIVETIYAGVQLELVPVPQREGGVRLDVHATSSDVELESFSTSLGVFAERVEIQIPALRRTEVRRSVDVRDGGTVLVRLGDDRDSRRFVLLTVTREALE